MANMGAPSLLSFMPLLLSLVVLLSLAPLSVSQIPTYPPFVPDVFGANASAPAGGVLGNCSGQLFAFSGLDGPTEEMVDFTGVFTDAFSLKFCGLKYPRFLQIQGAFPSNPPAPYTVLAATNDVLVADMGVTPIGIPALVKITWLSHHTLIGTVPPGGGVWLQDSVPASNTSYPANLCRVHNSGADAVAMCAAPNPMYMPFAVVYAATSDAAVDAALAAICMSQPASPNCSFAIDDVIDARLVTYNTTGPTGGAPMVPQVEGRYQWLLNKAVSIMRVNALAPEGGIKQRWSSPDRVPHQWMWLWDSCFHSLGLNSLSVLNNGVLEPGHVAAWEYLKSVLDGAGPDGGVAIERTPESVGKPVDQTQPPLLCWATWENYRVAVAGNASEDALARLQFAYPRLDGYLRWDLRNRADPTGATPFLVWTQGTESGMDNSQRFDNVKPSLMGAVDFSVFLSREAACLAEMAHTLQNTTGEAYWSRVAVNISSAIHARMWNNQTGLYHDVILSPKQTFSPIKAVTAFYPMWLPDFPKERLPQMLAALRDPKQFGTPLPIPSVSLDTEDFSTDMWRGPAWVNTNYMIALALQEQGAVQDAKNIVTRTLDCLEKYYEKFGVLFEFYDSLDQSDPRFLLRKGVHTGGVRDYHWTAALVPRLLLDF